MQVHVVDGTYELFRHYYAVPEHLDPEGVDVGAVRGVVTSVLQLLEAGATHVGVATDQVIESFRNDLYDGYKTGAGIDPVLWRQFPLLEAALGALGVAVWPLVEFEADDGLASAAAVAAADSRVETVFICTPDKDLGQCVGGKVVQFDRRNNRRFDAAGIREKFGVDPHSIPDYLALVGDSADGFPGLAGWGAKSTAAVLGVYGTLEDIPPDAGSWPGTVRGAAKLAARLRDQWDDALLFRTLARLRTDVPVGAVDDWRWSGPTAAFEAWTRRLGAPTLLERVTTLARVRGANGDD